MPKRYGSKHIEKVLKKHGFVFVGQKGSHGKFTNREYVVIVPMNKKEIPVGTFSSIVRQSGLSRKDFE